MTIKLSKTNNLKTVLSSLDKPELDTSIGGVTFQYLGINYRIPAASSFGSPFSYFNSAYYLGLGSTDTQLNIGPLFYYAEPAYAPYVPPYYFGDSTVTIKFTPDRTGVNPYSIKEIIDSSTYYYSNSSINNLFENIYKMLTCQVAKIINYRQHI